MPDLLVMTAYFVSVPDPQRGFAWTADHDRIRADLAILKNSVEQHGHEYRCITDVPVDGPEFIYVNPENANPYWRRWREFADYLKERDDVKFAVGIDGTDTEMLSDPVPHMSPGKVYVGSEPQSYDSEQGRWLLNRSGSYTLWFNEHINLPMLNAGFMSADRDTFLGFTEEWLSYAYTDGADDDMFSFAHLLYDTPWKDRYITGHPVHTVFKSWESTPGAWWRHK